ncbi:coniferyl-alcohol dehydrogenase [Halioxenophilus sp. WMMB6]|uniref:coniferyl-alcohol dehydrogenase n=1 Tax=Halioxenophilus sp. WMMB6 TaxID=3073815 RepID=UPI00295E9BA3|nr:coniferyl-alcohol dehydrogenase [Halioxenophilus sp. WMMB6]
MDFLGYKGKRVIVSGCFSGMGEATARILVEQGAEVHGLDFKETALELASFTQVDLRDPATIDAAVAKIGGKVDALFNCAGLPQTAPALDVMRVNFAGTRYVTEAVLPLMAEGSSIVSISSNGGMGWSRRVPVIMELIQQKGYDEAIQWCEAHMDEVKEGYAFSKEVIIVWTMLNAAHLIKKGIRMNCTMPGPTETPMMSHFKQASGEKVIDAAMQPIGRPSTPKEQATALVFLNSDAASYINGVALPVDGGFIGGVATGQVDLTAMMANAK